jgi:hypothetical protein
MRLVIGENFDEIIKNISANEAEGYKMSGDLKITKTGYFIQAMIKA